MTSQAIETAEGGLTMKMILSRLRHLLLYERSEMSNALILVVYGLWLPFTGDHTPLAYMLKGLLPLWIWGVLYLACGVLHLYGLLWQDFAARTPARIGSFCLWMYTAIISFISLWPAAPIYAVLSLSMGWAHVRDAIFYRGRPSDDQ